MAKHPTHVQQAYNELANGVRTGSEDAVTAARKRLDAAGEDGAAAVTEARERHEAQTSGVALHAAAAERRAKLQADVDAAKAESTPPQGRTTKAAARGQTT